MLKRVFGTKRAKRCRGTTAALVLRYGILTGWGVFCVIPIVWFLSIGVRPRIDIITTVPVYWPEFSLDAWRALWQTWPMAAYLRNSLLVVVGSVVLDLLLAIPAAFSLARYTYKGRDTIGFYILSTRMMVPAIVAIPIFTLFGFFHLLNTVWALILVYAALNLSPVIWIIRSYMIDVPREFEEAARIDGASDWAILSHIIIPIVRPGIITAAIVAVIFAMNEFLLTLLIASTKDAYTLSVALAHFTGGSDGIVYNAIALVAFIAFVPVLVITVLGQKHLSRGLAMGTVPERLPTGLKGRR